jgi:branched-chain amino acid transport system ATP-binding protein
MTGGLAVRDMRAGYGRMNVLHGLALNVGEGEMVALLGANGAGKTTTLRALAGAVRTGGSITFEGRSLVGLKPDAIARLGIASVPQGRGILAPLSVEENLRVGALGRGTRAWRRAALERAYDLFPRLRERRHQRAGSLSGGEQQMLALGRALAGGPRILLVDEPSLGLAPKITREVFQALAQVRAEHGTAMLIVEQNAQLALDTVDRGYVLEAGEIALEGSAHELTNHEGVRRAYLGV